jgi:hypothetical protein
MPDETGVLTWAALSAEVAELASDAKQAWEAAQALV